MNELDLVYVPPESISEMRSTLLRVHLNNIDSQQFLRRLKFDPTSSGIAYE